MYWIKFQSGKLVLNSSGRGELTSEYSIASLWVRVRVNLKVRVRVRVPVRVRFRVGVRVGVGVRD